MSNDDGRLIRHKKIIGGVRLGGAETYRIVAESDTFVIYKAWASDGRQLSESVITRIEFEEKFEPVPDGPYYSQPRPVNPGFQLIRRESSRHGSVTVVIANYRTEMVADRAAAYLNDIAEHEQE